MRVVFMGTPEFAVTVLETLVAGGYEVAGVYTQPDRPAGRGQRLVASPVKRWALEHGLAVFQPPSLRRPEVVQSLATLEPEAIVVAAYGKLLPPAVLAVPPKGVVNVHPSLLPKHRGSSPVITALLEGETSTGVTVMLLDEGMDTGAILAQRQTSVSSQETAGELTRRLFLLGAELLREVLPRWQAGTIAPIPQEASKATTTRQYTKEDGVMDWALPAVVLERRLRAFHPWPGCSTRWEGKVLKILEGEALETGEGQEGPHGRVVLLSTGNRPSVAVATGRGFLGLGKVQREGGRPQSVEDFLRGYPRFLGTRLPS